MRLSPWPVVLVGSSTAASAVGTDFDIVYQRTRNSTANAAIAYSYAPNANLASIPDWISSLGTAGDWPDINYNSGCAADLNVWLAEEHWARVIGMAQAWSGLNPNTRAAYANSSELFNQTQTALQYWFDNDYSQPGCLQANGGVECPCGTPGFWNKNWFFQGIGVPTLAARACLLLEPGPLTGVQRDKCLEMSLRGSNFSSNPLFAKYQTGSNLINILQDVITGALISGNDSLLATAYDQAMATFGFSDTKGQDGQHRDGSHLAHSSQIYNGAYGREFLKSFVILQNNAEGTNFQAKDSIKESIAALITGNDWQIFTDDSGSLRWDISVIGRYVASPLSPPGDSLRTLQFDPADVSLATSSFTGPNDVSAALARQSRSADAQPLLGNKGFWRSDYMVHRTANCTYFNKMISTRSRNAETVGGSNPFGYHINQGMLWSWSFGGEYTNITGAWDWYRMPGSTVLDHYPSLDISWIAVTGRRPFVGTASDGTNGVSVMDYLEPHDASISYRRAWFFFDDMVINVIANVSKLATTAAPIITVLDQRLSDGSTLLLDGTSQSSNSVIKTAKTVHYGGNGYYAMNGASFKLTTSQGTQTGNWSALSVTPAGPVTQDIFTAYHTMSNATTIAYAFIPKISQAHLSARASANTGSIQVIKSTGVIGIAGRGHLALSFWPGATTSQQTQMPAIGWKTSGSITVATTNPGIFMLDLDAGGFLNVWASDPTQLLPTITLSLKSDTLSMKCEPTTTYCTQLGNGVTLRLALPSGPLAGSTLSVRVHAT